MDAPAKIRERIIGRAEDERPDGISFGRTHDYISPQTVGRESRRPLRLRRAKRAGGPGGYRGSKKAATRGRPDGHGHAPEGRRAGRGWLS